MVGERRSIEIKGKPFSGPASWSENALFIAGSKYARVREGVFEETVEDILSRISFGIYPHPHPLDELAQYFDRDNLNRLMLAQQVAFNSPVWFNLGIQEKPQCSACFILSLDDTMESITDWWTTQTFIFKYGSGMGADLSKLREKGARVGADGTSSGPLSFARVADTIGSATKSGGITRRAATMLTMKAWHPDIREFIDCKARTERLIHKLAQVGYDTSLNSDLYEMISHQQANRAVRLPDELMVLARNRKSYYLESPLTGARTLVDADSLLRSIAQACWECGDPGVQFEDTIQRWHTIPAAGPINSSNPCSEYMSIDDSACNLASINLTTYLGKHGGFLVFSYLDTITSMIEAMDKLVDLSSYPTEKIAANTRRYRQLGLGYTNLGGLLMLLGLPYDSEEGRLVAASLMAMITAQGYVASSVLGEQQGAYTNQEPENAEATYKVLGHHLSAMGELIHNLLPLQENPLFADLLEGVEFANDALAEVVAKRLPIRNSQISVIAPTGTISFVLDAATTGIEPAFSVGYMKELVGGAGWMSVPLTVLRPALERLGYHHHPEMDLDKRVELIAQQGSVVGLVDEEHYPIFATAVDPRGNAITPEGHLKMLRDVQTFVSGAISKTINLPATATVDDFYEALVRGWDYGIKALTFYRDGSKGAQPIVTKAVRLCDACGAEMIPTGTCWTCLACGEGGVCG